MIVNFICFFLSSSLKLYNTRFSAFVQLGFGGIVAVVVVVVVVVVVIDVGLGCCFVFVFAMPLECQSSM